MNHPRDYVLATSTLPTLKAPSPTELGAPLVTTAGSTHVGRRRTTNEDHFLIAQVERSLHVRSTSVEGGQSQTVRAPSAYILAVADGMGGHGHGEVASAVTLDAITRGVAEHLAEGIAENDEAEHQRLLRVFCDSLQLAQERLIQVAERKGFVGRMIGTTATLAYLTDHQLLLAHVGDSRCYLIRGGELCRLTTDHTIGEALRQNGAGEELAQAYDNRLTNSVGGAPEPPMAELGRHPLVTGDRVLLCSDGVTKHLDDHALRALLIEHPDDTACCEAITEAAVEAGGTDNITALVASVR